jgi:hypothetical protein
MKYIHVYALFLIHVFHTSCGQNQTNVPKDNIKSETKDTVTSYGPNNMVRNVKKDRRDFGYQAYYLQFIYKGYIFIYNANPLRRKVAK